MKIFKNLFLFFIIIFTSEFYIAQVPYVPTPQEVVDEMLSLAKVEKNDFLYDLGCGDGRIVVTAAKRYGARGVGVDNNPQRITESNENAQKNGVTDKVEFRVQNLFETDLSKASVVTLYLLSEINIKLRPKLFKELKPGTRIVSHSFDMDEWEPDARRSVNGRSIFYWKIPANVSGNWEWQTNEGSENRNYELQLNQQFQKVTGVLKIDNEEFELIDPEIDGSKLKFSINKNGTNHRFNAEISGDKMTGTYLKDNTEFTAQRKTGTMKPLHADLK